MVSMQGFESCRIGSNPIESSKKIKYVKINLTTHNDCAV